MLIAIFIPLIFSNKHAFDTFLNHSIFLKSNESKCIYNGLFSTNIVFNNPICLVRCTFKSIQSTSDGGSVFINLDQKFDGKNFIADCIFINCQSKSGGAIYIKTTTSYTTEIINSTFRQNYAFSGFGGAIKHEGANSKDITILIKNCTFEYNSSNRNAGSVSVLYSKYIFDGCKFNYNFVNESEGGAAYLSDSSGNISNCSFHNNTVYTSLKEMYGYGGAISLFNSKSDSFFKCIFTDNSVHSTKSDGCGGAIVVNMPDAFMNFLLNETFEEVSFINNYAYSESKKAFGGAILIYKNRIKINAVFKNTVFVNNSISSFSTKSYGGAISYMYIDYSSIYPYSNISFVESIFSNNKVYSNSSFAIGGAVQLFKIYGDFINCTFNNNIAETFLCYDIDSKDDDPRSLGCAVRLDNSDINVFNCTFINNTGFGNSTKISSTGKGGAIYCSNSLIFICKSAFINNTLRNFVTSASMECSAFGGSCYFSKSKTSLLDCKFINNTVNFYLLNCTDHSLIRICGGAVYSINEKQLLNCTNCTFSDNNVFIPNNHEKEMAGAVYLTKGILNNCIFNDNTAHNGGDIEYNQTQNSQLMITNCCFTHQISKEQKIKSLIHFCLCNNTPSENMFTSNNVVISSDKISYLFDGEKYSSNVMLKFVLNDNCISPFDNKIYKSNDLSIYNMQNNNKVLFESAFKYSCQVNIFTQTLFSYFPTKTQYLPSSIPKPTASFTIFYDRQNNSKNEDKIKVLEKIIILLIAVIVLQFIFVSIFIYLFILICRRTKRNDDTEPLIESA